MNEQDNLSYHSLAKLRKSCEIDQDPDYHEAAPPDKKKLKRMEDTGKLCFGEKVKQILTKSFDQEIERQENEIKSIDAAIFTVQQKLHILRNVVLQNFFSGKRNNNSILYEATTESVIHPTVKEAIGKRPAASDQSVKATVDNSHDYTASVDTPSSTLKIPRYVPPKLPEVLAAVPVRGEHRCSKKKIYIGNISKWIPINERTDNSSHKWMVYVRGTKENPDISTFVKRVVFYLHPSYAPHDVVQVTSYPFHVTRRGWGEFPLRVQLFFSDALTKPVNVIHNLKLDRTYTGLQTLGAETIIDVYVNENLGSSDCSSIIHPPSSGYEKLTQDFGDNELGLQSNSIEETNEQPNCIVDSNTPINNEKHLMEDQGNKTETHLMEDQGNKTETQNETNKCAQNNSNGSKSEENVVHIQKISVMSSSKQTSNPTLEEKKTGGPGLDEKKATDQIATSPAHLGENITPLSVHSKSIQLRPNLPVAFQPRLFANASASPNRVAPPSIIRPVIVRCINKEGVAIRLPINLLRKAIVVRPSRYVKPGESLLRAPLLRASINPSMLKVIAAPKPEPNCSPTVESTIESDHVTDKDDPFERLMSTKWSCTTDCVRKIVQNIRIIDSRAQEFSFRSRWPFTCSSLEIFNSWTIGKQRSAEWLRAKTVRDMLQKCIIPLNESVWSVKTILRWCRHHGYSPITGFATTSKQNETETTPMFPSTISECKPQGSEHLIEADSIIDVENLTVTSKSCGSQRVAESITLCSSDTDLTHWITSHLKKFGYKVRPEPCDNALVNITSILFTNLWKSVADDLIRRSLRESWERNQGANPSEVSLNDAFLAIVNRPEYDLLTNSGLALTNNMHSSST